MAQEPLATKGNYLHIYDFRVQKGHEDEFIKLFEEFDYSDGNPMHKSKAQVKDGVLCRDTEDPQRFFLIAEWSDIEEHARIRKILANELKPAFIKYIEGGKFVPKYVEVVLSTPDEILNKAAAAAETRRMRRALYVLPLLDLIPAADRARAQGARMGAALCEPSAHGAPRGRLYGPQPAGAGAGTDRGRRTLLAQSLAIIEYLDEKYPSRRCCRRIRSSALMCGASRRSSAATSIRSTMTRVLKWLGARWKLSEDDVNEWYRHWIAEGMRSFEATLNQHKRFGKFCFGDTVTLADVCLVPQIANARRFKCPLDDYPRSVAIADAAAELPAFKAAHPSTQGDAM